MIIDATDLIIGRLASFAAKQVLLGETVYIVNCENAIISGDKKIVLDSFLQKRERGTPTTGPFIHRQPEAVVRRTIRGMLPYKQERGKEAFRRVKCYRKMPKQFASEKLTVVKGANMSKLPNLKYIQLKTISQRLGAKIE